MIRRKTTVKRTVRWQREGFPWVSPSADFAARVEKQLRLRTEADRRPESWQPPGRPASCGAGLQNSAECVAMSATTWWIVDLR